MNKRNTGLRRMAIYLPLATLAFIGATTLAQPQGSQSEELVALCERVETAVPQSCGCTVERARQAGVNETDLRSLLDDDGKREPVAQSTYSRLWQLKIQCIGEATMAGLPQPGGARAAALPPARLAACRVKHSAGTGGGGTCPANADSDNRRQAYRSRPGILLHAGSGSRDANCSGRHNLATHFRGRKHRDI